MFCLTNICYVCLEKRDKFLVEINSTLPANQDIIHIIGYLPFNLAWLKTKRIILICKDCCRRLRETYQFLAMCLKNSALMRGYMDKLNTASGPNAAADEAELSVCLSDKHGDNVTNEIKCEIKLEHEEIFTFEMEDEPGYILGDGYQQLQHQEASDTSVLVQGTKRAKSDNSDSGSVSAKKPKKKTSDNETVNSNGWVKSTVDTGKEVAAAPMLEVRVKPFKEMLTEKAFERYEEERAQQLKQGVAVLENEPVQQEPSPAAVEDVQKQRQKQKRRQQRDRIRKPNDVFRKLLSEAHLHGKSTFSDFARKYSRDERFKNVPKKGAREGMFSEYLHLVRKREAEQKSHRHNDQVPKPQRITRTRTTQQAETAAPKAAREELPKLVTFPCRYMKHGCKEMLTSDQRHEDTCSFRQHSCPILEPSKCAWCGVLEDLLRHCKQHHPNSVLANPAQLTHTVTSSNCGNYLIRTLDQLFLVQVKVCTATSKVYHAVRLLTNAASSAGKYTYDVIFENRGTEIRMNSDVLQQGCHELQDDTALALGIDSLLEVLGPFQKTTFTVIVRAKDEQTKDTGARATENAETSSGAIITVKCVKCQCLQTPAYKQGAGWLCRTCGTALACCPHPYGPTELDAKRHKHEMFFCTGNAWCLICRTRHCSLTHPAYVATNQFLIYVCSVSWEYVILNMANDMRRVVCSYWLGDTHFDIYIYVDAATKELHKFTCTVDLEHPQGGAPITRKLDVHYDRIWDWHLRLPRGEFTSYAYFNQFKMNVSVVQNQWKTRKG